MIKALQKLIVLLMTKKWLSFRSEKENMDLGTTQTRVPIPLSSCAA